MRRLNLLILLVPLVLCFAAPLRAQTDARAAFAEAKNAFGEGNFGAARDLLITASQTDRNNPEVFLWLGKSHYQLGEIEQAIQAWRRTVDLAPDQPYADRMLKALRAEVTEVEARIKLVETLFNDQLFETARREASQLRTSKVVTPAQRARLALLQAEADLEQGKPGEARSLVHRLVVTDPANADPARTALLLGWSRLSGDASEQAEAIVLLKKLIVEHVDTRSAAAAELLLIYHGLRNDKTAAKVELLAEWIAAHPDDRRVSQAREKLVDAYLELTLQGPTPNRASVLSASDQAALDVLVSLDAGPGTRLPLVTKVLTHLQKHYGQRMATDAALAGLTRLSELRLTLRERRSVLMAIASLRAHIATIELEKGVRLGRLRSGPLPESLAAAVAVCQQINERFPAEPSWETQVGLAEHVLQLTEKLPPGPFPPANLPPTVVWAVELALPVIGSGTPSQIVAQATKVIDNAIAKTDGLGDRQTAIETALSLTEQVLNALPEDARKEYRRFLLNQAGLLGSLCQHLFDENQRLGKTDLNARLTDNQKKLISVLGRMAQRAAADSKVAFDNLQTHLRPWIEHGHFGVAEQAYAALAPQLTPAVRRELELAVVNLRVDEVYRQHAEIMSAGLAVPRELEPRLAEALLLLYEMQGPVDPNDAFLGKIRTAWSGIVKHFRELEYFDAAEAAIKTAPEQPNENAAAFAQLELAHLRYAVAQRELSRMLALHSGKDRIELTPAFQTAVDAYTAFVTNRPDHPLAAEAVENIFNIARTFEKHAAYPAATKIYRDFAAVAAKIPALSVSPPGATSTAERAAFAAAVSMDAEARRELAQEQERRQPDDDPPQEISDTFTGAIAAYRQFAVEYPKSVLVSQAFEKTVAIALAYVNIEAWMVADAIYAGALELCVGLRHPERLKFCRALCQLGPAMSDHAKQILAAVTLGPVEASSQDGEDAGEMLARLEPQLAGAGSASQPTATTGPAVPQTAGGGAGGSYGSGGRGLAGASGALTRPAAQPGDTAQIANRADRELAQRYAAVSQAVQRQQMERAAEFAMLRDQLAYNYQANNQPVAQQTRQAEDQQQGQVAAIPLPVLSDAEIARIRQVFKSAYTAFHNIEIEYPHTAAARQARDELLVMVAHWRSLGRFSDSAQLAAQFLADHPTDTDLVRLRLETARDLLAFASQPVKQKASKQTMLSEVAKRFSTARQALETIIQEFPDEKAYVQQAQWDIANSYLTKARVVSGFSSTRARGQYVQATRELQAVADQFHDHPNIARVPQMLFQVAEEVFGKAFAEEAIIIWTDVTVHYPSGPLAEEAARRIAQVYESQLDQPLRAAEIYQELNFVLGGGNLELQNTIFNIGRKLKTERRWVEALHILETVVDTFPRHPHAGQTLAQIGEIHQANEAWEDAIAAYERAISEYNSSEFVKSAKWSIAECKINLSRWQEAIDAYQQYLEAYSDDPQAPAATARIDILKELASYQEFVDERGQRKADDAQFQIARIVHEQLANPVKAIIEYRKVAEDWPTSHLADDALHKVGTIYVTLDETEKAREALRTVAEKYPSSSLADDALFLVGKSFEDESQKLATVTRKESLEKATEFAQKRAYEMSQDNRRRQRDVQSQKVAALKKAGKTQLAENEAAFNAAQAGQFDAANVKNFARQAFQEVETLSAAQLADRQDKINAALRKAVTAYMAASRVAAGDKAAEALLRMAKIYDEQLKDSQAAVTTWMEIVRQFSGTSVAEDASWRIAQFYERSGEHQRAIEAYEAFLRNYRRSPNAGPAQAAIAENYERLGEWIKAMDAYTNYLNNYPDGAFAKKSRDRINWIKTYRL